MEFWQPIIKFFSIGLILSYARYFLIAGPVFFLFYVWKKQDWFYLKIQQKFPDKVHLIHEIKNSVISLFIFAIIGVLLFLCKKNGYTKIYNNINDYSLFYVGFSVVFQIIFHDFWFYWTHRLMHHKTLYRFMHLTHHHSTNPTPWAAFSFHWSEAIVEAMVVPVMTFLLPLHPLSIVIFLMYMTVLNVFGHLGFELLPKFFTRHFMFKWHNTSVHHNMHHKYVNCNYSLYFNFWDRVMGTNHERYLEEFDEVKNRTEQKEYI